MLTHRIVRSTVALAIALWVSRGPIVKQIDHILFVTGPEGRALVSMLTDQFELPLVFDGPTLKPPSPGTAVGFGNVSLEVIPLPPREGEPPPTGRITSLAVQSVDSASTTEALQSSGIDHFPPASGPTYEGDPGLRYTTIGLRGLGHPMFFIQYLHDMDARRARFERTLRERDGGPLGVMRIGEVAISSSNLDQTRERWTRLLGGPSPDDKELWPAGDGPAIRFVAPGDRRLGRMVVVVKDLKRAADVLRRLQVRAETTADGLQIDPAGVWGLRIILRE